MSAGQRLNLDVERFLAHYWQRKPLLIRGAVADFVPPLSSDELAGLALEADVESRIIEQSGDTWRLHHGPFKAEDFVRHDPWTLLVQAVDHYVPAVADLFRLIDFLPRWRMDDVMVSYAVDGGGVGPHFDSYDVFLLQGEGRRLWRLGQRCDGQTRLLPHEDLRILHAFDTIEEHLLETGDILYVPPGVAHWGIAQGECTTFSIGLRAPRVDEMLSRWSEQKEDAQQVFDDAGRDAIARPGELAQEDIDRALTQMQQLLARAGSGHWFGELVTEPRYDIERSPRALARARKRLRQRPRSIAVCAAAKLAWRQQADGLTVYANGNRFCCAHNVLPSLLQLCEHRCLQGEQLDSALGNPDTAAMLDHLLQHGCIDVH